MVKSSIGSKFEQWVHFSLLTYTWASIGTRKQKVVEQRPPMIETTLMMSGKSIATAHEIIM